MDQPVLPHNVWPRPPVTITSSQICQTKCHLSWQHLVGMLLILSLQTRLSPSYSYSYNILNVILFLIDCFSKGASFPTPLSGQIIFIFNFISFYRGTSCVQISGPVEPTLPRENMLIGISRNSRVLIRCNWVKLMGVIGLFLPPQLCHTLRSRSSLSRICLRMASPTRSCSGPTSSRRGGWRRRWLSRSSTTGPISSGRRSACWRWRHPSQVGWLMDRRDPVIGWSALQRGSAKRLGSDDTVNTDLDATSFYKNVSSLPWHIIRYDMV